ncbi:MAG: hypothetical protein OXI01_09945, partial [Albidovulum sp.]|nr:hypothetical protein [Albidovulum sp.]
VIASAGIDLSVGSAVVFIIVVAFGLIGGAIAYVKIPPFIARSDSWPGCRDSRSRIRPGKCAPVSRFR